MSTINRAVPATQEIVVGLGDAGQVTVGLNRFTDEVYNHVFEYGLRQILNDAHASVKKGEGDWRANKLAMVEKRLEKLYTGNLGRAPAQARDPIGKETSRLAKAAMKSWGEAACTAKREKLGISAEDFEAKVVAHFRPQAEKNVAALAAIEIEL